MLVKDGRAIGSIAVMGNAGGAATLQQFIAKSTGVTLPITRDTITAPAIVLGDCDDARALGLDSSKMPPEGFAIRTAPGRVFIVGNNQGRRANGVEWGVYEFVERFLDVRWYFQLPTENGEDLGQSIPRRKDLIVQPVSLEDAPVFRMRVIWPEVSSPWNGSGLQMAPLHAFHRAGNSWPNQVVVHAPQGAALKQLAATYGDEILQMRQDGSRDDSLLSYAAPETMTMYLAEMHNHFEKGLPSKLGIRGQSVTVSPGDLEIADYHPRARELWDDSAGQWGSASRIMADFVQRLAEASAKKFPNVTIVFLPYLNYTFAPDGYKFPGNVEVQLCGMPGLASYKEPAIREAEQANIDKWVKISGRKIQNWHYDVWPAHKTKAAYQYPHVVKRHYLDNRDKTVGTFINGEFNHWPRQNISLYAWLRVLWNPDFNVDAAVDAYCKRMFGPAGETMRQLVQMQIHGWEDSQWPGGRFSPKGIYESSFPREDVEQMEALWATARRQAAGDPVVTARLDYLQPPLLAFFDESRKLADGTGVQHLQAQKVGELPVVDGKLDDTAWKRATANSFVQSTGDHQGELAKYPTTVRAVWNFDGMTFGFHMYEPKPKLLNTEHGGHDNGELWWDDNVEIFLDVTGKNEGEFYQLIVNAAGDIYDARMKDISFEMQGVEAAITRGSDFWSMEVFIPYAAFPNVKAPRSGEQMKWFGNFTRHRVADARQEGVTPSPGSTREYQRMNTTGSVTSDNLADFAEIQFIE